MANRESFLKESDEATNPKVFHSFNWLILPYKWGSINLNWSLRKFNQRRSLSTWVQGENIFFVEPGCLHFFLPPSLLTTCFVLMKQQSMDKKPKIQWMRNQRLNRLFLLNAEHCGRTEWCSHLQFCCSCIGSYKLWVPKLFYNCFYNLFLLIFTF